MTIDQCLVKRILVETGSSVNILFKDTFKKIGIQWDKVIPYVATLVGFMGNNEAKYDALLAGLHMAKSLKLTHILVCSDSQVVMGKVTRIFEAKEENMKQYLACVQQLPSTIKEADLVLRKTEVSRVDPYRKLDPTWEGPYQVIKDNVNKSYKLQDFEEKILARTWNNLNLRKLFP
ncbi:hypothetical protein M9H77_27411 [Catharanthus roseus]|uniref:Uncharacterized protein n=1 Tax=Catharanthus roseus TaxID=4058 RepID=A0ACC0ACF5_CATRO|nr:hypothetical protein M9H77_27411 [Catharanthus roseus]